MLVDAFRNSPPGLKLLFFLFLAVVLFLASMLAAMVVGSVVWGWEAFVAYLGSQAYDQASVLSAQKLMQAFYSVGLFVLPPLAFAAMQGPSGWADLGIRQAPRTRSLMYAIVLFVGVLPLTNWVYAINQQVVFPTVVEQWLRAMETNAERITQAFLAERSTSNYLINLLLIAALPALGEELFFRAVIQKQLYAWLRNPHLAVWLAAALFSALHLQFYGFLPRLLLGALLGYLFLWSGSLWLPVVAHFLTNALTISVIHFSQGAHSERLEALGNPETGQAIFALYSLMLVSSMLLGIHHNESTT